MELGTNLINIIVNTTFENFTEELKNSLKNNEEILSYSTWNSCLFTQENNDNLWNKLQNLINESINMSETTIYEVINKTAEGYSIIQYNGDYENRENLTVSEENLPENIKSGMFLKKEGNTYIIDKEITENIYYKMKKYEQELIQEQKENLNEMKIEGATYEIIYKEDDCETWYTELKNIETGETFQDVNFPHDLYHEISVRLISKI